MIIVYKIDNSYMDILVQWFSNLSHLWTHFHYFPPPMGPFPFLLQKEDPL